MATGSPDLKYFLLSRTHIFSYGIKDEFDQAVWDLWPIPRIHYYKHYN